VPWWPMLFAAAGISTTHSRRASRRSGTTRAPAHPSESLTIPCIIACVSLPAVVQSTNLFSVKRIDTHTSALAAHILSDQIPSSTARTTGRNRLGFGRSVETRRGATRIRPICGLARTSRVALSWALSRPEAHALSRVVRKVLYHNRKSAFSETAAHRRASALRSGTDSPPG